MPVPWNERDEYTKYLRQISLISGDCRLHLSEEIRFLDEMDQNDLLVQNRQSVIRLLKSNLSSEMSISVSYPKSKIESFDSITDDSWLKATSTIIEGGSLALAPYVPPTGKCNADSIAFLNNLMDNKLSLTGVSVSGIVGTSKGFSGFILSYELLCGHLDMRILVDDSPKYLGCMLARALPLSETIKADLLSSILRVLMRNTQLGDSLPQYYEELKKAKEAFEKASAASKGTSGLLGQFQGFFQRSFDSAKQGADFLDMVCKKLKEASSSNPLNEAISDSPYLPPKSIKFVFNEAAQVGLNVYQILFGIKVAEPAEISCGRRYFKKSESIEPRFDDESILALATVPLNPLDLKQIIKDIRATQPVQEIVSSTQEVEEIHANFYAKFSIRKSPACTSRNSKEIIDRLSQDLDLSLHMESQKIPNELLGFSHTDIARMFENQQSVSDAEERLHNLCRALRDMHGSDCDKAQRCIDRFLAYMVETSNTGDDSVERAIFSLAHLSGQAPYCSFEYFASLLLDSDFGGKVLTINPFLKAEVFENGVEPQEARQRVNAQGLENLLVGAMLSLNRAGLAARALANVSEVLDLLKKIRSAPESDHTSLTNAAALKCEALSELLATRRGYTTIDPTKENSAAYDPRFLLFEFTSNVILRNAQIALVDRFVSAFGEERSLCHQLIMGAGKTTVIAPLLALILGTRSRLVVQVCQVLVFVMLQPLYYVV